MVMQKRKTASKVVSALRSTKGMDIEETEEAQVVARKLLKKPAAAQQKEVEESEEESEEVEEEESEEASEEESKKMMKKPAAVKMDVEESDEEEEEEEEEESDEEEETAVEKKQGKLMKKPAAVAGKKMEVDEEEEESSEEAEEESEAESEEETEKVGKVMKKPAAVASKKMEVEESEDEAEEEEASEEEEESEEAEEDASAQMVLVEKEEVTEKEVLAERAKELKGIGASDLKELLTSNGLATGTKEVMIKALLKHEAKVRTAALEQKAKIRGVVVAKKQELEALSPTELGKLCNDMGLKGLKSKPERVQRLLVQWQENDGVDQALNRIAHDARKEELVALDVTKLRKLCSKVGVDPFVKEIMVERITKQENMTGCFARPAVKQAEEAPKEEKKIDMIDELLASEAQRKKEKAAQSKKEEALASKRKELKALSVEELKKKLTKKGMEATGKRDEMVDTLFIAAVQEDAVLARKAELQAKSTQDLKDLCLLNRLEAGAKEQMVKTMLAHEAKCREELRAFEAKVAQVAAEKAKVLENKSNAQLKELCASKDLPVKGEKNERIERIIEEQKKDCEFDKVVSTNNRNKREQELMALDKPAVLKICENAGVDPSVKDIMVERIMSHESEAGAAIAAGDDEPAAKKARMTKK